MKNPIYNYLKMFFIVLMVGSISLNILFFTTDKIYRNFKYTIYTFFNFIDENDTYGAGELLAYYFNKDTTLILNQIPSGQTVKPLPKTLIIKPGFYSINNSCYFLEKDGLYRFVVPGKFNEQRIVYDGDIESLLSSVCWIISHGNEDNYLNNNELSIKAMNAKISLTCGIISRWTSSLLNSIDVKNRVVAGLTLDSWNNYDNGHTLLEVWIKELNKWVLFDLDNNSYFLDSTSLEYLSLIEFSLAIDNESFRIIPLASDAATDINGFVSNSGYRYDFIHEFTTQNLINWYKRVMQVPMIYDSTLNKYLSMDINNKEKIESYTTNYKVISKKDFITRYYSN